MVTDNRVHHCNWPDHVTANEKKKMEKVCALFISKVHLYKSRVIMLHYW